MSFIARSDVTTWTTRGRHDMSAMVGPTHIFLDIWERLVLRACLAGTLFAARLRFETWIEPKALTAASHLTSVCFALMGHEHYRPKRHSRNARDWCIHPGLVWVRQRGPWG